MDNDVPFVPLTQVFGSKKLKCYDPETMTVVSSTDFDKVIKLLVFLNELQQPPFEQVAVFIERLLDYQESVKEDQ